MVAFTLKIAQLMNHFFSSVTAMARLFKNVLLAIPLIRKNPDLTVHQMRVIGVGSLPLVFVSAIFIGATTILQTNFQFQGLAPMRYLGFAVSKALITEICPVISSFVIASRISTAIAAEIGSMKTTEQLDAMCCLSLDSIRYVIMPKIVAAAIMLPVLVIFSEFFAYMSSVVIAFLFIDVTMYTYLEGLKLFFYLPDLLIGIAKTSLFGIIIAMSGAHFGLECSKGAQGIGGATTSAVMLASILILILDFMVALIVM